MQKWNCFLQQQVEPTLSQLSAEENLRTVEPEVAEHHTKPLQELTGEGNASGGVEFILDIQKEINSEKEGPAVVLKKSSEVQKWVPIRPSLNRIEHLMSSCIKKRKNMIDKQITTDHNHLPSIKEGIPSGEELEQAYEEEYNDSDRDNNMDAPKQGTSSIDGVRAEALFPWKEELEFLVHGGVPRDLRGEVLSSLFTKFSNSTQENGGTKILLFI